MEAIVCHMRPSLEHLVQFHSFSIWWETQFLIAVVKKIKFFLYRLATKLVSWSSFAFTGNVVFAMVIIECHDVRQDECWESITVGVTVIVAGYRSCK